MTIRILPAFSPHNRTPGRCSVCKGSAGKVDSLDPEGPDAPVVDLDCHIEQEGNVEICNRCAAEIGSVVGMLSPIHAQEVMAELVRVQRLCDETASALSDKEQAVTSLAGELHSAVESGVRRAEQARERGYAEGYAQGELDAGSTPELPVDPSVFQ